jgi:hypothetical protein
MAILLTVPDIILTVVVADVAGVEVEVGDGGLVDVAAVDF